MLMHEKIERSRANAQRALDAYRESGAVDPDDQAAIGDLIADLLHLADYVEVDGPVRDSADLIAFRAIDEYAHEVNPANANDHV